MPNHAFSAGTVLAMSGDAIHMDYYSRLGPIDPQVANSEGRLVPALGYLERYNALIEKAQAGSLSMAEAQLLIDGFDQAQLYAYEQARELSTTLLKDWLVRYKFKTWKTTATKGTKVTRKMRTDRAQEIAEELNNTARWHTHGHGISRAVLEKDLNVRIDDFGKDAELSVKIRDYHSLLDDYMGKMGAGGVVHVRESYRRFM